jgi:hypothetical protein
MDSSMLYLSWFSSSILSYLICLVLFKFVKRWELFVIIMLLSLGILFSIDTAFWGVAPFSNKYELSMVNISFHEQLTSWFVKGMLFSSSAFTGVAFYKRKHNKALK